LTSKTGAIIAFAFVLGLASTARAQEDEETTLFRNTADDEDTTITRRTVRKKPESRKVEAPLTFTGRFNGYYYGKYAFDVAHNGNDEDVFDFRNKFGLSAEVSTSRMTKVFLSARFSHYSVGEDAGDDTWYLFNSNDLKRDYELEPREIYIYIPNDIINIRLGNQIVRWGFGQFNKPSDVLNPVDFREGLFSDLETPLIPTFMLHLDKSVGPANLSLVWLPFFKGNRTNLFGHDWAPMSAMYGNPAFSTLGSVTMMFDMITSVINSAVEDDVQPLLMATNPPENKFENGQWGAKTEFSAMGVDFQLSYLYGWDKMPWIHMDNEFLQPAMTLASFAEEYPEGIGILMGKKQYADLDMTPEEKDAFNKAAGGAMHALGSLFDDEGNLKDIDLSRVFQTSYRRQSTIGLSLSTVLFERIGLKIDSAYSPSRTIYLESPAGFPMPVAKPAISYSVGLDYNKSSTFDVMLEFYHFHVLDLKDDEEVFIIGSDMYMVTLATHLRLLDFEALEFQLAGMLECNTLSWFLFPKVSYKATDSLKLAVGGIFVGYFDGGNEQGPGGLFDRNDSVYLDLKYSF